MKEFKVKVTKKDIKTAELGYPDNHSLTPENLLKWARRTSYYLSATERALAKANKYIKQNVS
jgi:hypothetical protein